MSYKSYNTKITHSAYQGEYYYVDWPGSDGCATRRTTFSSSSQVGSASNETKFYQDKVDFGQIKSASLNGRAHKSNGVRFFMTPYWTSHRVTENFLTTRGPRYYGYVEKYIQNGSVAKWGGSSCVAKTSGIEHYTIPVIYSVLEHDYSSYSPYVISAFDEQDVNDAFDNVRESAAVDALSSYDVLTDLCQLKEIPGTLTTVSGDILSILRSLARRYGQSAMRAGFHLTPRRLLRNASRVLRRLGNEWMNYRYGIMPLVYSLNDIVKTTTRGYDVTTRKVKVIQAKPTGVSLPADSVKYVFKQGEGSSVIRCTIFQHFDSEAISRLSGLSFNPIQSGYELIPMSWMFDWFVNMGDYIAIKTNQTLSETLLACVSRRDSVANCTYVHFPSETTTVYHWRYTNTPWLSPSPPTADALPGQYWPSENQLIRKESVEAYWRKPINIRDVRLRLDPTFNWKRGLDSSVLSFNLIRNLIKKFSH